jgi:hypothetical protein
MGGFSVLIKKNTLGLWILPHPVGWGGSGRVYAVKGGWGNLWFIILLRIIN